MMYVKKFLSILGLLFVTIAISVLFSSCDILDAIIGNADTDIGTETDVVPNESKEHIHNFSMWEMTTQPSCTVNGMQTRVCTLCGFSEYSPISAFGHTEVTDKAVAPNCTQTGLTEGTHCSVCNETLKAQDVVKALGHTEVEDSAVSPTCLVDGKTAGSHCSVCNTIIIAQTVVSARGHTSITDPAIAATCTTDGKTEGAHCGVCQLTLVEQTTIKAQGHQYDEGVIVTAATCIQVGTKKYTCTVSTCSHFYNETYSMQTFTATELYNQSVKYVGEIVTYDKSGNEYALGTGFVYSTDGKIITNYHVIDGAYSATITINNTTYPITYILAYDENIDLAILQINASGLTAATVCKNPVQTGETVYAIGSSRGLTNTYSQGIITYADRVIGGVSHIQHDASITHGNSGGPLINVYGEVVGINTWGISDSQNLNFAVFADEIDNLVYGTAMSLSDFYDLNNNPYQILFDWLLENYNAYTDTQIRFDYIEGDNWYSLGYDIEDGFLYIDLLTQDDSGLNVYSSLDLSNDPSQYFYYSELTDNGGGIYAYGYINAATYTTNTMLSYVAYNDSGLYYNRALVMDLFSSGVALVVGWFEWATLYYDIGITIADLGFVVF